jgi:hypothetical protein
VLEFEQLPPGARAPPDHSGAQRSQCQLDFGRLPGEQARDNQSAARLRSGSEHRKQSEKWAELEIGDYQIELLPDLRDGDFGYLAPIRNVVQLHIPGRRLDAHRVYVQGETVLRASLNGDDGEDPSPRAKVEYSAAWTIAGIILHAFGRELRGRMGTGPECEDWIEKKYLATRRRRTPVLGRLDDERVSDQLRSEKPGPFVAPPVARWSDACGYCPSSRVARNPRQ